MIEIRPIVKKDDKAIARVIRNVLEELGVTSSGTSYTDPHLDYLSRFYSGKRSIYFVVLVNGKIIGGAGIAELDGEGSEYCELQKMYVLPKYRLQGIATRLIHKCLDQAKKLEYKNCYLETMDHMIAAQKLYLKHGFRHIKEKKGCTNHDGCPVYMIKYL